MGFGVVVLVLYENNFVRNVDFCFWCFDSGILGVGIVSCVWLSLLGDVGVYFSIRIIGLILIIRVFCLRVVYVF